MGKSAGEFFGKKALRRISVSGSPTDSTTSGYSRHLICQNAGKLRDVKLDKVREDIKAATGKRYFICQSQHYICEDCRQADRIEK
ncbi:MAG: hypothetical protein ACLTK0_00495 [Anaerovoracaceae bacterium]